MALFSSPLFANEITIFSLTFSAQKANDFFYYWISFSISATATYLLIQGIYKLIGWEVKRRFNPIVFVLWFSVARLLTQPISSLLFPI